MIEPVRRSFTAQRRQLGWRDWGAAGRPALVLLHGRRDHARSWDATADALAADWRVVAPDMRGHGDSDWSPEGRFDADTHLYDLAAFMDALGEQPTTAVAHSFGAHLGAGGRRPLAAARQLRTVHRGSARLPRLRGASTRCSS